MITLSSLTTSITLQPLAYVAGPYRASTEWQRERNIRNAENVALWLWKTGYVVICPHKNTENFGGAYDLPDETWLEGGLNILLRCDLVVVAPNWQLSNGTLEEIIFADAHGIPIFYWEDMADREKLETFAIPKKPDFTI